MTPAEIRAARKALGMTQGQFAQVLHTTERTVRNWEAGARNMQPVTLDLLSRIIAERAPRT
jgi:DNA-binding transcriptional regulator YiaG